MKKKCNIYYSEEELFHKKLRNDLGTRLANAIGRLGINSMEELMNHVKEHPYADNNHTGHHQYWSHIGRSTYFKLIDYLYPKES